MLQKEKELNKNEIEEMSEKLIKLKNKIEYLEPDHQNNISPDKEETGISPIDELFKEITFKSNNKRNIEEKYVKVYSLLDRVRNELREKHKIINSMK